MHMCYVLQSYRQFAFVVSSHSEERKVEEQCGPRDRRGIKDLSASACRLEGLDYVCSPAEDTVSNGAYLAAQRQVSVSFARIIRRYLTVNGYAYVPPACAHILFPDHHTCCGQHHGICSLNPMFRACPDNCCPAAQ